MKWANKHGSGNDNNIELEKGTSPLDLWGFTSGGCLLFVFVVIR